jgi:hypothetical protein
VLMSQDARRAAERILRLTDPELMADLSLGQLQAQAARASEKSASALENLLAREGSTSRGSRSKEVSSVTGGSLVRESGADGRALGFLGGKDPLAREIESLQRELGEEIASDLGSPVGDKPRARKRRKRPGRPQWVEPNASSTPKGSGRLGVAARARKTAALAGVSPQPAGRKAALLKDAYGSPTSPASSPSATSRAMPVRDRSARAGSASHKPHRVVRAAAQRGGGVPRLQLWKSPRVGDGAKISGRRIKELSQPKGPPKVPKHPTGVPFRPAGSSTVRPLNAPGSGRRLVPQEEPVLRNRELLSVDDVLVRHGKKKKKRLAKKASPRSDPPTVAPKPQAVEGAAMPVRSDGLSSRASRSHVTMSVSIVGGHGVYERGALRWDKVRQQHDPEAEPLSDEKRTASMRSEDSQERPTQSLGEATPNDSLVSDNDSLPTVIAPRLPPIEDDLPDDDNKDDDDGDDDDGDYDEEDFLPEEEEEEKEEATAEEQRAPHLVPLPPPHTSFAMDSGTSAKKQEVGTKLLHEDEQLMSLLNDELPPLVPAPTKAIEAKLPDTARSSSIGDDWY